MADKPKTHRNLFNPNMIVFQVDGVVYHEKWHGTIVHCVIVIEYSPTDKIYDFLDLTTWLDSLKDETFRMSEYCNLIYERIWDAIENGVLKVSVLNMTSYGEITIVKHTNHPTIS